MCWCLLWSFTKSTETQTVSISFSVYRESHGACPAKTRVELQVETTWEVGLGTKGLKQDKEENEKE